jgi:hypothetical protein
MTTVCGSMSRCTTRWECAQLTWLRIPIARAAGRRGRKTPVLGSDYPQLTLAKTLDALERLGPNENEEAKIRYANAHSLLQK